MENQSQQHQAHVQDLIENGYEFRFGDYLSEGMEIFKQNIGGFVLYALVMMGINMVLGLIPIIGSIGSVVISAPLTVGFYIVARKIRYGGEYEFGDFFGGFQKFMPLFLTSLIGGLLTLAGFIFLVIPGIYLAIAFSWGSLMVWFFDYEFWPALDTSRKIISKNWFPIFGFLFVLGLILMGGALAFGIGILFAIPFMHCCVYAAFDDILKPEGQEGDQGVDLTDHLVDEQM